jgi:diguanylate cyclase (GGDEF)-like protein/PAS domain S-box-containing protein
MQQRPDASLHAENEALRQQIATLRTQADILRQAATALLDLALLFDAHGHCLEVLAADPELLRRSPDELPGTTLNELFAPQQATLLHAHIRQALTSGQAVPIIHTLTIDGHDIAVTGQIRPLNHTTVCLNLRPVHSVPLPITDNDEARRTLQRAVEQSPASIVITDTQGNITYVNPKFTEVTGYTFEEALGQNPRILKSGEKSSAEYHTLWQTIAAGQEWRGEFHNQRKDGSQFWEYASISPVFDDDGNVTHFVAVKEDITQRKEDEEALRASEARYRFIADNATDMITRYLSDGTFGYVSPACTALLGYAPDDLLGRSIFDLLHPDDLPHMQQTHQRTLAAFRPQTESYRVQHVRGHYIWLEMTGRAIRDPHAGHIVEVLSIARDITERKRIEHDLEHSLALLRSTLDSTAEGMLAVGLDGSVITYNQRFQDMWHLPPSWTEHTGRSTRFHELTRRVRDPEGFVQRVEELRSDPHREAFDTIELRDGRIFERTSTPYRVGDQIVGRVWSFRDVTAHRRAEVERRASQTRLQAMFDNATVGVVLMDSLGRFIELNERWAEMLGRSTDEVRRLTCVEITHPDDKENCHCQMQALIRGEIESYRHEGRMFRQDGSMFWADLSVRALRSDHGSLEAMIGIIADITERKEMHDALQHANAQLSHWVAELERHNEDMTLINQMSDQLQRCRTVEDAYQVITRHGARLFDQQAGALYIRNDTTGIVEVVASWGGEPPLDLLVLPPSCRAMECEQYCHVSQKEWGLTCPAMQHLSEPCICTSLTVQGDRIGVLRISSNHIEHTQHREQWERLGAMVAEHLALALTNLQLRARLHEQSIRDPLTGLYNRRYLDETLGREIRKATRHQRPVGVIMLDLDYFKQFNDTYGHDGGDTLLRAVGTFLQQHIRGEDIVCRYGGEEFTLILPEATLESTVRRAEEIRSGIRRLSIHHGGNVLRSITASLGIAAFPEHGPDADTLMKAADTALYQAKAGGRNQSVIALQSHPYAAERAS